MFRIASALKRIRVRWAPQNANSNKKIMVNEDVQFFCLKEHKKGPMATPQDL